MTHYVTSYEKVLGLKRSGEMKNPQHVEGFGWREYSCDIPTGNHYMDNYGNIRRKNVYISEEDYAALQKSLAA